MPAFSVASRPSNSSDIDALRLSHSPLGPFGRLLSAPGSNWCRQPAKVGYISARNPPFSNFSRQLLVASMCQARSRCCFASTNSTQLRLLGCCKPIPQPLQRMPEKHLARQGVFGFLCGLETVPGVVLAQSDL